ncbi:MAG: DUF5050 domain-containing protein [Christensenellaceae bacterium]|jgi:hypothetical protein|nr:DUF5050 domain-containing protein [Christensenellaceae bacterium]
MLVKPKYKWQDRKERSVYEIITEDGVMRPKEIRYLVQQLCRILDNQNDKASSWSSCSIHPQTILVNVSGIVRLSTLDLPLSAREAYIPPEQDQFDKITFGSIMYALGMVMLFMATGHEKKADLDAFIDDSSIRALIVRCIAFDPRMRFQNIKELSSSIRQTKRGRKSGVFLLLFLVCACTATSFIFLFYQRGNEHGKAVGKESGYAAGYASGYEKGFSDAPGIGIEGASFVSELGNLSGNLTAGNGAIAARSEDEIFFLFEKNIYRMNPYTGNMQLFVANAGAHDLNYDSGWLYYCTDASVLRVNPKTMKEEVFCDSRSGQLYIADGNFYLHDIFDTGYLYRISENEGTLTQLNDMTEYHCLNIMGEKLYFIDAEKSNNIYCCNLDGGNLKLISSNSFESFCIYDDKIYAYAASFEKDDINYSASFLICMDLDGGNIESFTNIPAYYPNVTDGGIFYITGNNRTLEWMSHNGRTHYTIVSSRTSFFNIAGRWIFYLNEEDGGTLWRVRIDGSDNVKVVEPRA